MDSGVYIAIFRLDKACHIKVGSLGRLAFQKGLYFYVGSAQKNMSARLARHARQDKVLRWHIDYLSVQAELLGAIMIQGGREHECELAGELGRMYELAVPGFGSSDCRCGGHLFYAQEDSW